MVSSGLDPFMTSDVYKTLVARYMHSSVALFIDILNHLCVRGAYRKLFPHPLNYRHLSQLIS